MSINQTVLREFVKRKLSAAKAGKGWSWQDLSKLMAEFSTEQSGSTLTTKHSRGAFKVQDYFLMMKALGVAQINLDDLEVPGLNQVVSEISGAKKVEKI